MDVAPTAAATPKCSGETEDHELKSIHLPAASDGDSKSDKKRNGDPELGHNAEENCEKGDGDNNASQTGMDLPETKPLFFKVTEIPPPHLTFFCALQQIFLAMAGPLAANAVVSEVVCARNDDEIKTQILSATFMISGLATVLMTIIGVRLPIFQGPSTAYVLPLLTMKSMDEWKCPDSSETSTDLSSSSNTSIPTTEAVNGTTEDMRDIIYYKIGKLSGTLLVAGSFHFLLGITGLVGVIIRYVGPITVVPTVVLLLVQIYPLTAMFCQTSWIVSTFTAVVSLILFLYLANCNTPIPIWTRKKGCHIIWYPVHQSFALLISVLAGWALSAILTEVGFFSDEPGSRNYFARTDARSDIIERSDWFYFPYPGQFGHFDFSTGALATFFVGTILSVLDSLGDYSACARVVRVPLPPPYAFNRGIAVEGLISFIGGTMGACHTTSSYGGNVGAIGASRIASRIVVFCAGLLWICFAIVTKIGAIFISLPQPVLGGMLLIVIGIIIGFILSYLQTIDLNSTRNLSIIGIALLLGFVMSHWAQQNPNDIKTGNSTLDNSIMLMLGNPAVIAFVFSCLLDNTVPGTLKERGMHVIFDRSETDMNIDSKLASGELEEGTEVYRLPLIPDSFYRTKFAKFVPLFGPPKN